MFNFSSSYILRKPFIVIISRVKNIQLPHSGDKKKYTQTRRMENFKRSLIPKVNSDAHYDNVLLFKYYQFFYQKLQAGRRIPLSLLL